MRIFCSSSLPANDGGDCKQSDPLWQIMSGRKRQQGWLCGQGSRSAIVLTTGLVWENWNVGWKAVIWQTLLLLNLSFFVAQIIWEEKSVQLGSRSFPPLELEPKQGQSHLVRPLCEWNEYDRKLISAEQWNWLSCLTLSCTLKAGFHLSLIDNCVEVGGVANRLQHSIIISNAMPWDSSTSKRKLIIV